MPATTSDGVQGSLDSPPIVITSALEKAFFLLLVGFLAFAGSFAMINDTRGHGVAYIGLVFGILGLCSGVLQLISPLRLTISPEGVVFSNAFKTQRYAWDEISEFVAYRPSSRTTCQFVGFIRKSRPGEQPKWQTFTKGMTGVHGTFGNAWPMSASDLVDLLNSAKDRWGEDSDAGLAAK